MTFDPPLLFRTSEPLEEIQRSRCTPRHQAHVSALPKAAAGVSVNGLSPSCVFRAERGCEVWQIFPSFLYL